jgi:hypothetical protein
MFEQVKPAEMRWSEHYCCCFGTKRPRVQIPPPRRQSRRQAPGLNSTELAFDSLSDELRDYGAGQDQRTMPLADRLNSIPGRAAKHSRALGAGAHVRSTAWSPSSSTLANKLWKRLHLFLELGEHGALAMGSNPACDMGSVARLPLLEGRLRDEHSVPKPILSRSRGVPRRLATFDNGIGQLS